MYLKEASMLLQSTSRLSVSFLLAASFVATTAALSQQATPSSGSVVQPGAPGQVTRTLPSATKAAAPLPPQPADIEFMQGMIMHHSQAVEMTALLKSRSHNPEVQALGERINISQGDEIRFMHRWLEAHNIAVDPMGGMSMDGVDMNSLDYAPMPGMLTLRQMNALEKSTGPAFDHLFLTGMVMHHTGALTMVKDLTNVAGTNQDADLFDFVSDVVNTQQAEIDIMNGLLRKEKK
jgi:uncharacterized protein (DUF305 family)